MSVPRWMLLAALMAATSSARGEEERENAESHAGEGGETEQERSETDSTAEQARRHFMNAMGLFAEGNGEGALAEFRASFRLRPHPTVLYNIGLVERDLHRYGDAVDTFRRYLEEGPDAGEPTSRLDEVRQILAELEAVLATVSIEVDQANAQVFVEGEFVGTAPLDEPLHLAAGEHTIEIRLDGFQTHTETVEVHGQEHRRLFVELVPSPVQVQVQVQPQDERHPWYRQWWLWTAVGIVVAGVAAAIAVPMAVTPGIADFGPVEVRSRGE